VNSPLVSRAAFYPAAAFGRRGGRSVGVPSGKKGGRGSRRERRVKWREPACRRSYKEEKKSSCFSHPRIQDGRGKERRERKKKKKKLDN